MKKLVLFDIDETLICSDGAGRRAIGRALETLFGVSIALTNISLSGKTDLQIYAELLKQHDITQIQIKERLQDIIDSYLPVLKEEIEKASFYIVLDGVTELLDDLYKLDQEVCLGLLTGNVEPGARMKLERFKLNHYFPIGAYGSDSASRLDLPQIALARAQEFFQHTFAPYDLVIIGDSVNDVLCAKNFGATSIAINTGRTSKEELQRAKPDFLFSSLKDTSTILQAILNRKSQAVTRPS